MRRSNSVLFTSYFTPRAIEQMEAMFGKFWSMILYIRFKQKKNGMPGVSHGELKAMIGFYTWMKAVTFLMACPRPVIKISNNSQKEYGLTEFGIWLADTEWKILDSILKLDKAKTLTEILEEKAMALKMTIDEINSLSEEEKEDNHTELVELNNKITADNPTPAHTHT